MITKEEARAWLDSIVDATLAYRKPLQYGSYSWEYAKAYEPWCGNVPIHDLASVIKALGVPLVRVYSPAPDADEINFYYRGLLFTDYIRPKRIGKKTA